MQLLKGRNLIISAIAFITLLIPVILLETHLLRHTGGTVSFPLDSSFLNISVAKNLAFYKVWGVSKYTFQPATSSLLYPFVLALIFFITGAHLVIPVILNAVLAILFLYSLQQALIRLQVKPLIQGAILPLVILVTALPLLVVSGTESVLQLLLCFLFIETLATAPQSNKVYQYGLLVVATRYEDILLILLTCILLLPMQRRQALQLAAFAIAPIFVFGAISLTKDNYFLPTPMIMAPYPPYLVTLTLVAFLAAFLLLLRKHRQPYVLLPLAIPLLFNNILSLSHFERDSVRIYEQQYPIAAFVHRYYKRGTIGANNVAALTYFSEGRKVNYTGATGPDIDSLTLKNGVSTAILSDSLFETGISTKWYKIASWNVPDTRPGATRTFTFYSIHSFDSLLQHRLRDFQPLLPTGISVRYY